MVTGEEKEESAIFLASDHTYETETNEDRNSPFSLWERGR
jgi:hypothetical protein